MPFQKASSITHSPTYFTALHLPVMQTALNEADKNEQTADVFWLAGVWTRVTEVVMGHSYTTTGQL